MGNPHGGILTSLFAATSKKILIDHGRSQLKNLAVNSISSKTTFSPFVANKQTDSLSHSVLIAFNQSKKFKQFPFRYTYLCQPYTGNHSRIKCIADWQSNKNPWSSNPSFYFIPFRHCSKI